MDVDPVDHLRLRLLVVKVVLDAVGHVLRDVAALQLDVAAEIVIFDLVTLHSGNGQVVPS